jgi:hypothetical protein
MSSPDYTIEATDILQMIRHPAIGEKDAIELIRAYLDKAYAAGSVHAFEVAQAGLHRILSGVQLS